MKKSTLCYWLCGLTVVATMLISMQMEGKVQSFVVLGLGLLFVLLFDAKGDEYLHYERKNQKQ